MRNLTVFDVVLAACVAKGQQRGFADCGSAAFVAAVREAIERHTNPAELEIDALLLVGLDAQYGFRQRLLDEM